MSRITHLNDGSMIKADVVESFDRAVDNPENINTDGYIDEAFEYMAADYDLNIAWDRLQVLKTDYLGMEAV
jgi:hypothetical protein